MSDKGCRHSSESVYGIISVSTTPGPAPDASLTRSRRHYDHGPDVDWLVSPLHLTLTPLLHASCHGSTASDPPASSSQLSNELRGKAVVAAFPVFLFQLKGRPGQELQCYRDLTFVPVSPILKIFLFSDGPPQPPSIPKYVSATNMLKDGYIQRIHSSTSTGSSRDPVKL